MGSVISPEIAEKLAGLKTGAQNPLSLEDWAGLEVELYNEELLREYRMESESVVQHSAHSMATSLLLSSMEHGCLGIAQQKARDRELTRLRVEESRQREKERARSFS